jgi:hypothetical protein
MTVFHSQQYVYKLIVADKTFANDYIQLHTKVIIYQPNNFLMAAHLCPVIYLQIEI